MRILPALLISLLPFTASAIEPWEHEGGSPYPVTFISAVVADCLTEMGVPSSSNLHPLLLETMAAESGLGTATTHGGGSYGVMQLTLQTSEYFIGELKKRDPAAYQALMQYRRTDMKLKDDIRTNVPLSICIAASLYLLKVKDLETKTGTRAGRARIWKFHYNTSAGAGSEAGYMRMAKAFLGKEGTSHD